MRWKLHQSLRRSCLRRHFGSALSKGCTMCSQRFLALTAICCCFACREGAMYVCATQRVMFSGRFSLVALLRAFQFFLFLIRHHTKCWACLSVHLVTTNQSRFYPQRPHDHMLRSSCARKRFIQRMSLCARLSITLYFLSFLCRARLSRCLVQKRPRPLFSCGAFILFCHNVGMQKKFVP